MTQAVPAPDANVQELPPGGQDFLHEFITETDYAARRDVSIRTCQRDRQLRKSPPYIVIGRRIYYRLEAIRQWLLDQERHDRRRTDAPHGGGRR